MFSYKRNIRLNDCDPAGIVFFARVYDMAHEAFEAMLIEFQNPIQKIIFDSEIIYPLVESCAKYQKPLKLGNNIIIQVKLDSISENAFTLKFEFQLDSKIMCIVNTTQVSINKSNWQKTPIEENFRTNLESLNS